MKNSLLITLLLFTLFSSCSFEKRIYRNGFYFDRNEDKKNIGLTSATPDFVSAPKNLIKKVDVNSASLPNEITANSIVSESNSEEQGRCIDKQIESNHSVKGNLLIHTQEKRIAAPDPTKEKQKLSDQSQTVLGAGLLALIGALLMFLAVAQMGMWLWFGIAFIFIAPIAAVVGMILGCIVLSKLKVAKETMPHDKQKASTGFVLSLLGLFLIFLWLVENGDWLSANF